MMFWDDRCILGIGLFIMILMLVLVIGGMVFFIKIVTSRGVKTPETTDSVMEILKTRYAKGEITREEFEQMKKDLR